MNQQLADDFTIHDDFPPVDYQHWRSVVEESLGDASFQKKLVKHSYEGIDIQPLYAQGDAAGDGDPLGFPGLAPFVRGGRPLGAVRSGWDLRQEHSHPDLGVTNQAILDDLRGGATSLLLRLDSAARGGFDPDQDVAANLAGHDGVMAYCVDDLTRALANVDLKLIPVTLDAGAAFMPAAAMMAGLWQLQDISAEHARGAFNADPFAVLALQGQLPQPPAEALSGLADLAAWTANNLPHVTSVGVNTLPYHDAGANAAQDIAFALGTAVEYLRAMRNAGLDVDTASQQILFRMGLGTHHFLSIAKLRAARQLWSRVVEVSGGTSAAAAMRIHTRTGNRVLTRCDPYVNLLRNTVAVFAAGIGGADVITSVPFDTMLGLPSEFSRRIARNTLLVLREEAHLHRVIDPAGGSWFLDTLTVQLAEKAWEVFQAIERQGGMLSALRSEWVAKQIDVTYAERSKDIARRKVAITGVSEFPDLSEQKPSQLPVDAAALRTAAAGRVSASRRNDIEFSLPESSENLTSELVSAATRGATMGQMARECGFHRGPTQLIRRLEPRSFAEPFEELRDASDAWRKRHGHRPRVFLANMGPVAEHTARAAFSKSFFESGGFEVIGNEGFGDEESAAAAFAASGAKIAAVCSSDQRYATIVPPLARQLKAAGARSIVLAGAPGDAAAEWQSAGIDRFIYIKCDVLATLRDLLTEEGVLSPDEH